MARKEFLYSSLFSPSHIRPSSHCSCHCCSGWSPHWSENHESRPGYTSQLPRMRTLVDWGGVGRGGRRVNHQSPHSHIFNMDVKSRQTATQKHNTHSYLWWSWVLLWKRRHLPSCRGVLQKSLLLPHWGHLGSPGKGADGGENKNDSSPASILFTSCKDCQNFRHNFTTASIPISQWK